MNLVGCFGYDKIVLCWFGKCECFCLGWGNVFLNCGWIDGVCVYLVLDWVWFDFSVVELVVFVWLCFFYCDCEWCWMGGGILIFLECC